jgi:hypothetical protein
VRTGKALHGREQARHGVPHGEEGEMGGEGAVALGVAFKCGTCRQAPWGVLVLATPLRGWRCFIVFQEWCKECGDDGWKIEAGSGDKLRIREQED